MSVDYKQVRESKGQGSSRSGGGGATCERGRCTKEVLSDKFASHTFSHASRYMERQLRENIGFDGTPLRLLWRGKPEREKGSVRVGAKEGAAGAQGRGASGGGGGGRGGGGRGGGGRGSGKGGRGGRGSGRG